VIDRDDVILGLAEHRECGGRVSRMWGGTPGIRCEQCGRAWSDRILEDTLSQEQLDERFTMPAGVDASEYVLVDEVDPVTRRRHSKLIRSAQLQRHHERTEI
jgi:hypothetical protein